MTTSASAWHPYTQSTNDESRIRLNQPAGFAPLKQKYIDALLHEEVDTSETVHKVCLSIAMSAFASGWAISFVEKMLLESPALGPNIQKRGIGRLTNILTQAKARANPADISAHVNALRVRLAESRTAIQSVRWPRVDGIRVDNSATTKVLLAILDIADAAATTRGLHLAVRRIGLESGTNKSVAGRAIKRLRALDILRATTGSSDAQHWHAKGYDVNLDAVSRYSRSSEGVFDHTLIPYLSHDAFRRGALGPTSLRVLATMLPGSRLEVSEIAEQVGLSGDWVKVILTDRLAAYRLVSRSGDFWSRCPNAVLAERLDEAALFCGKAGERARLAAVYEQERHHFRWERVSPDIYVERDTGVIKRVA
jgi:hypothetical protein